MGLKIKESLAHKRKSNSRRTSGLVDSALKEFGCINQYKKCHVLCLSLLALP